MKPCCNCYDRDTATGPRWPTSRHRKIPEAPAASLPTRCCYRPFVSNKALSIRKPGESHQPGQPIDLPPVIPAEELLAFYDYPAQHWQSIRTSNPIESTFGTFRHRAKRSKGCLSRDGMLHMMFKLGLCAEKRWRRLRGFDYLAKVVTGIKCVEVTEVDQAAASRFQQYGL